MDKMPTGNDEMFDARRERDAGSPAARELVASYTTYKEAQRAVDYLADEQFAVEQIAIVAEGLSFVEQVTGRLTWGRALLNGLAGGAMVGLFIGFLFGLLNFFAPLVSVLSLALYGLLFGAVTGAIIGAIGYAMSGGNRDFTSVGGVRADRYNVVADASVAAEARRLLERMPATR